MKHQIKLGEVILDKKYSNSSKVNLIVIYGKHFGRVESDGIEWDVMLSRLSKIENDKK